MSIDPTPPSDQLPSGSTEGVRAGTKTKFNFVALVGGLALIVVIFAVITAVTMGGLRSANSGQSATPAEASTFDPPVSPAKGDSPSEGDAVDPINTRKDGPSDPSPSAAN